MRLPNQFSLRRPLRFNVTPLIDVVFLLIIFFLVASHFVRSEHSEPVDLPVASTANQDDAPDHRLTITIREDGQPFVSGQPVTVDAVMKRIAGLAGTAQAKGSVPEVHIRADRNGRYGSVRQLIEQCAKHGIRSIQFAVSREGRFDQQ